MAICYQKDWVLRRPRTPQNPSGIPRTVRRGLVLVAYSMPRVFFLLLVLLDFAIRGDVGFFLFAIDCHGDFVIFLVAGSFLGDFVNCTRASESLDGSSGPESACLSA